MSIQDILHVCEGPEILLAAFVQNAEDIAVSPTDYWTFDLRVFHGTDTLGRTIGKVDTTSQRLDAGDPVTVYDEAGGLRLQDGDQLRSIVTKTGSPPDLSAAKFLLNLRTLQR